MSYYLLNTNNKFDSIITQQKEQSNQIKKKNINKLNVKTNHKINEHSKSIPIDIPNVKELPSSPTIINRKSSKETLMIDNNNEMYYSYDLVFPPHDPPSNRNTFNDYCEHVWHNNTFSPASYERYEIDSYF